MRARCKAPVPLVASGSARILRNFDLWSPLGRVPDGVFVCAVVEKRRYGLDESRR